MAMQRIVGGIQIEGDLRWRFPMRVQEQIDEHRLDGIGVRTEASVTRGLRVAEFQPVQRALARQRRAVRPQGGELACSTAITWSWRSSSWSTKSS